MRFLNAYALLAMAAAFLPTGGLRAAESFDPSDLRVARVDVHAVNDDPSQDVRRSAVLMSLASTVHYRLLEGDSFEPAPGTTLRVERIREDGHVDLIDADGNRLTIYAIREEEKKAYLDRHGLRTRSENVAPRRETAPVPKE